MTTIRTIHIALDLETWGTDPGDDIRSIGACWFDPLTGRVCDTNPPHPTDMEPLSFYVACDNPTITKAGLGYDDGTGTGRRHRYNLQRNPQTVQWWNDQSEEARAAFADPVNLREALKRFATWLQSITPLVLAPGGINDGRNVRIWSHGAAFDPPILATAYKAVGLPVPWDYRAPRDTRTAFDLAAIDDHSALLEQFTTGTHHHALDDAICEAKAVCEAYRVVRVAALPTVAPRASDPPFEPMPVAFDAPSDASLQLTQSIRHFIHEETLRIIEQQRQLARHVPRRVP